MVEAVVQVKSLGRKLHGNSFPCRVPVRCRGASGSIVHACRSKIFVSYIIKLSVVRGIVKVVISWILSIGYKYACGLTCNWVLQLVLLASCSARDVARCYTL